MKRNGTRTEKTENKNEICIQICTMYKVGTVEYTEWLRVSVWIRNAVHNQFKIVHGSIVFYFDCFRRTLFVIWHQCHFYCVRDSDKVRNLERYTYTCQSIEMIANLVGNFRGGERGWKRTFHCCFCACYFVRCIHAYKSYYAVRCTGSFCVYCKEALPLLVLWPKHSLYFSAIALRYVVCFEFFRIPLFNECS